MQLYNDGKCEALQDDVTVGSSDPFCVDVIPLGAPVRSIEVATLAYQPGTCAAAGGEAVGSVTPSAPTTFCCR